MYQNIHELILLGRSKSCFFCTVIYLFFRSLFHWRGSHHKEGISHPAASRPPIAVHTQPTGLWEGPSHDDAWDPSGPPGRICAQVAVGRSRGNLQSWLVATAEHLSLLLPCALEESDVYRQRIYYLEDTMWSCCCFSGSLGQATEILSAFISVWKYEIKHAADQQDQPKTTFF